MKQADTVDSSGLDELIAAVDRDFGIKIPLDVNISYTEDDMKIKWDQFERSLNPSSG
jgi:hypothetical protein